MNFPGKNYLPPESTYWQGRQDSLPNERYFQKISLVNLLNNTPVEIGNSHVFLGFCSDTGIKRNLGSLGAKEGPFTLRKQLAKLACHNNHNYIDIGNIQCTDDNLEQAQDDFAELISYCHQNRCKTIAFGGGHEIAWAHFLGLNSHYSQIGIINLDAHFDLRPLPATNFGTSGTPFLQIKDHCRQLNKSFNYCCLGIQPHANTPSLFQTALDLGVSYLTAEAIHTSTLTTQFEFLNQFIAEQSAIYLTICLDAFAESAAPGVSAPQPLGLLPSQAIPLLKYIIQSGKVVSLDIAELSPALDLDYKTARLAAFILAELLDYY